jgi:hypothetical protein
MDAARRSSVRPICRASSFTSLARAARDEYRRLARCARHGAEEPKYRGDSLRVDAKNATSTLKIGRADKGVRLRSRRYAAAAADAPNGL